MRSPAKIKRKPQPDLRQLSRIEKGVDLAAKFTENLKSPFIVVVRYDWPLRQSPRSFHEF